MKTTITSTYILLGGAFLLSSCSQEETPNTIPDVNDRRITFHASLPELTSRASEIVNNMKEFYLTVYDESDTTLRNEGKLMEYYNELKMTLDGNSSKFRSDNCVWPDPGLEEDLLHFFAFYPLELPAPASYANHTSVVGDKVSVSYKVDRFTVDHDIANHVDFMTAFATGSMADNIFSGIKLDFEHRLSRVEVKAWGANKSCDIEIAGVRIGGIPVEAAFDFTPASGSDFWTDIVKGYTEYIFRQGDELVTLSKSKESHFTAATAVSIMGSSIGDENNCAMVIPVNDPSGWDYANDLTNSNKKMYISVLMRITDNKGTRQYPYHNTDQGINALEIPVTYLTVDKATGKTVGRLLYKDGDAYFTDKNCTVAYSLPDTETVKEFGWASVPVTGDLKAGTIYTYTLDYTSGIGLHDPSVGDAGGAENYLKAGDPVISDRVGVSLGFNDWTNGGPTSVEVPGN